MAEMNFGPWRLGKEREYDGACAPHGYRMIYGPPGSGPIARVYETGTALPSGEPVPNARLMVSAPDLLAACEAVLGLFPTPPPTALAETMLRAVRAAVAKARGR